MRLSILIPTLEERIISLKELTDQLYKQIGESKEVEILINSDNRQKSIGQKRNELLKQAKGDYIVFIDDDDRVPSYYIEEIFTAIKDDPDCVGINGVLIVDNNPDRTETFEHKLDNPYTTITQGGHKVHLRYPNHLNPIKRENIEGIYFQEINFGEDAKWATEIRDKKCLTSTYNIGKDMYYYLYNSKK